MRAKGSVNKRVGQHPLRERAKKIHLGILVIRFEMPFNVWCEGCGSHIGKGVRYNAEKKKVGNYYSTPVYSFTMKCHLCPQQFVIETDPKNCDYRMVSGVRRKNEAWEPEEANVIPLPDDAEKQRMASDAMFRLEHTAQVSGSKSSSMYRCGSAFCLYWRCRDTAQPLIGFKAFCFLCFLCFIDIIICSGCGQGYSAGANTFRIDEAARGYEERLRLERPSSQGFSFKEEGAASS